MALEFALEKKYTAVPSRQGQPAQEVHMAAGSQYASEHRIGDRYIAELENPPLTLVVSLNPYQRWTVVIVDRSVQGAVVDLHEEGTLPDAQRYAEGYAQGGLGLPIVHPRWVARPRD